MLSSEEKNFALSLARRAIEHFFYSRTLLAMDPKEASEYLKCARSCFVTLTIGGELRGCMGHVEPIQPLYQDIIENAVAAAFNDPRFSPLQKDELRNIGIEISILTPPKPLRYSSTAELFDKLQPLSNGVILRRGHRGATYLPQVWEEIHDKEDFLSSLCVKAGLPANDWQKPGMEVWTYVVEMIREEKIN